MALPSLWHTHRTGKVQQGKGQASVMRSKALGMTVNDSEHTQKSCCAESSMDSLFVKWGACELFKNICV